MNMNFTKMHGAGNDFIIINNMTENLGCDDLSDLAKKLCNRRFSIGADGLMVVEQAAQKKEHSFDTGSQASSLNSNSLKVDCEGVKFADIETCDSEHFMKNSKLATNEAHNSGVKMKDTACDFRMLYFNADGSEGEMCGNGARCIARYGYEFGLAGKRQRIETKSGIVEGERIGDCTYRVRLNPVTHMEIDCFKFKYPQTNRIAADRLEANVFEQKRETSDCEDELKSDFLQISYVELGKPGLPHAVIEFKGLNSNKKNIAEKKGKNNLKENNGEKKAEHRCSLDFLKQLAKSLRYHKAFSKGANINFYEICKRTDEVYVVTYERGVEDFTLACGTGAASTVAVLKEQKLVSGKGVQVHTLGGTLTVDIVFDDRLGEEQIYLTGEAILVATGQVRI